MFFLLCFSCLDSKWFRYTILNFILHFCCETCRLHSETCARLSESSRKTKRLTDSRQRCHIKFKIVYWKTSASFCVFQSSNLVLIMFLFLLFVFVVVREFLSCLFANEIINFSNNNNSEKKYRIRSLFISQLEFSMMSFYSLFFFDSLPSYRNTHTHACSYILETITNSWFSCLFSTIFLLWFTLISRFMYVYFLSRHHLATNNTNNKRMNEDI